MANKWEKVIIYTIIVVIMAFLLKGCGGIWLGLLGPSPEEAMIKYLEKKYDEDVTCKKTVGLDSGYMVSSGTKGEFLSNKHPGLTFECSAYKDGIWSYNFYDDYQVNFYQTDVQNIMKETAEKYFEGEYYVVADPGTSDPDTVEVMSFEEYIKGYDKYCILIYVFDMPNETACAAMKKFVADVEKQGYSYTFYLGRNVEFEKEDFMELIYDKDFSPWYKGIEWIYYKRLPLKEGEEPEIYTIAEEQYRNAE